MFDWVFSVEGWVALATLLSLEIVLGIDNIIFISILVGRLPPEQRRFARNAGLGLAMITRLALLFSLVWLMSLSDPIFSLFSEEISARDLILLCGGLFLIAKSTHEIHAAFEPVEESNAAKVYASMSMVLVQIAIIDIVFSLDSIITAVGLVDTLSIMVIAVILAVMVMLFAAGPISDFVEANPTLKMLALSFLILIGFTLIAESLDLHVPKAYIYFAMAFSVAVEMLNLRLRRSGAK